jgi:radical SAM superfamily enzyme with C-terminal helix-hairpin-helix motif
MNKTIRFLLILVLLVGVVAVAGSKVAWAGSAPASDQAKAEAASALALKPGTVVVPVPNHPEQEGVNVDASKACPVSIRGHATLCALTSGTEVFGSLRARESGYLSKVVSLYFTSGSARLCFGAPQGNEVIYVDSNGEWVPLYTFYVDGQACVDVSTSGLYVLGK